MSDAAALDRRHYEREYDRLAGELMTYFESVATTERWALLGAAGTMAFLYTDLPSFAAEQARLLAAVPLALILLAGLRCLSIFVVMLTCAGYMRDLEGELLSRPDMGMQRRFRLDSSPQMWLIVGSTTLFWLLAVVAAGYFWMVFEPSTNQGAMP